MPPKRTLQTSGSTSSSMISSSKTKAKAKGEAADASEDGAASMASHEERVASFSNKHVSKWPHPHNPRSKKAHVPTPDQLATVGFYYAPDGMKKKDDRVQHYLCSTAVSNWHAGDDPLQRLRQANPHCPTAVLADSVAAQLDAESWKRRAQEQVVDDAQWDDPLLFPQSEHMLTVRLATFATAPWPHDPPQAKGWGPTSRKLAQAGFHANRMERGDDLASCSYCGRSLSGWEKEDDPRDEHLRGNKPCPFFRAVLVDAKAKQHDEDEEMPQAASDTEDPVALPKSTRRQVVASDDDEQDEQDEHAEEKEKETEKEKEDQATRATSKPNTNKCPSPASSKSSSGEEQEQPVKKDDVASEDENFAEENEEKVPSQPKRGAAQSKSKSKSKTRAKVSSKPEAQAKNKKPSGKKDNVSSDSDLSDLSSLSGPESEQEQDQARADPDPEPQEPLVPTQKRVPSTRATNTRSVSSNTRSGSTRAATAKARTASTRSVSGNTRSASRTTSRMASSADVAVPDAVPETEAQPEEQEDQEDVAKHKEREDEPKDDGVHDEPVDEEKDKMDEDGPEHEEENDKMDESMPRRRFVPAKTDPTRSDSTRSTRSTRSTQTKKGAESDDQVEPEPKSTTAPQEVAADETVTKDKVQPSSGKSGEASTRSTTASKAASKPLSEDMLGRTTNAAPPSSDSKNKAKDAQPKSAPAQPGGKQAHPIKQPQRQPERTKAQIQEEEAARAQRLERTLASFPVDVRNRALKAIERGMTTEEYLKSEMELALEHQAEEARRKLQTMKDEAAAYRVKYERVLRGLE